jgi:hypothetical protein
MNVRVFWDVAPCSPVGVHRRFRDAYCLHRQFDLLLRNLHGALSQKAVGFTLTALRT